MRKLSLNKYGQFATVAIWVLLGRQNKSYNKATRIQMTVPTQYSKYSFYSPAYYLTSSSKF